MALNVNGVIAVFLDSGSSIGSSCGSMYRFQSKSLVFMFGTSGSSVCVGRAYKETGLVSCRGSKTDMDNIETYRNRVEPLEPTGGQGAGCGKSLQSGRA